MDGWWTAPVRTDGSVLVTEKRLDNTGESSPALPATTAGQRNQAGSIGDARDRGERTLAQRYTLSRGILIVHGVLVTAVSWSAYRC